MSEFLRLLLDSVEFLWPFRRVWQWEIGAYYVCGRYWRTVTPGIYPVIPWFIDVRTVSVAEAIVVTPRQDVTLKDGTLLSFQASATCHVVDIDKALNRAESFSENTQEALSAVLAEKLAEVDPERFEPSKRGRLLSDLLRWVGAELADYGVEVTKMRFINFVLRPKTLRLIQDSTAQASW